MKLNDSALDGQSNHLLKLQEIASWQLDHIASSCVQGKRAPIYAELPALQRGAVWKAAKVELFWDSLIRGFPVGSFLLSPYDERLGHSRFKLETKVVEAGSSERFHLLDGQQRATAIAVGFLDIWSVPEYEDGPTLWVDLGNNDSPTSDRAFLFRLLTRSHPWGYGAKDTQSRLRHADIRSALICYRKVADNLAARGATLSLRYAWPWDAVCPMPVSILLTAAAHDDWHTRLEQLLRALPMWHDNAMLINDNKLIVQWKSALEGKLLVRLQWMIAALREETASRTVPAIIMRERTLPPAMRETDMESLAAQSVDAVETLFVRINTAGEALSAEDLIYSSLKTVWPQAPQALENLLGKQRIVAPEHMVTFLYRLHQAFSAQNLSEKAPFTPDVAVFRASMKDHGKLEAFQQFVERRSQCATIVHLFELVRMRGSDDSAAWKLPPTLSAALFSGSRGLEILFISAAWIMRMEGACIAIDALSVRQQRRTLGFLVAMSEFAELPEQCVARLWTALRTVENKDLPDFFNAKRYKLLLPMHKDNVVMLPLVPPRVLGEVIRCRVSRGQKGFPGPGHEDFWRHESLWQHYYSRLVPDSFTQIESGLRDWLYLQPLENKESGAVDEATRQERRRLAWSKFFARLWDKRSLVDYAQRDWLMRWFPDHDPTLPGQMEDLNRPWDYDHIHPQGLLCNEISGAIRDWHRSIGNLRAWPLELNRADQKNSPLQKLAAISDQDDRNFGMASGADIRKASFIDEDEQWACWQSSVPNTPGFDQRYLARYPDFDLERRSLIEAMTTRFCALYAHWFDQLCIGDLQGK